jgi:anti-anti-sigma regulatory factor
MTAESLPLVRIERTDTLVVISFHISTLDKKNFAQIADDLDEVLRDPNPRIVEIDISRVLRFDELGMAFLQSLQESIKDVGGKATLRGSAGQMKRAVSGTRPACSIEDPRIRRRPPLGTRW